MSLLSREYPMADASRYIIFDKPHQADIDPIFASRLAALARDVGKVIHINSGYRDIELQKDLFIQDGGYQLGDGTWVGGTGYVAKPGQSWHNYGCAIDTRDMWLKQLNKYDSTDKQDVLRKYGLFKPLTMGNARTVLEDWHIQPIETNGVFDIQKKQAFYDSYQEAKKNMHFAQKYYDWLVKEKGIKISETRFEEPVTRGELMVFLARILGYKG